MQTMPLVNFGGHRLPYNGPLPPPELVPLVSPPVATPDPSYPKDLKGEGKERAAEENLSENHGDVDTSIDYANFDANRSRGPVYRGLCLVRLSLALPCNAVR